MHTKPMSDAEIRAAIFRMSLAPYVEFKVIEPPFRFLRLVDDMPPTVPLPGITDREFYRAILLTIILPALALWWLL